MKRRHRRYQLLTAVSILFLGMSGCGQTSLPGTMSASDTEQSVTESDPATVTPGEPEESGTEVRPEESSGTETLPDAVESDAELTEVGEIATEIGGGLVHTGRIETEHAKLFRIDAYRGGYILLTVADGRQMLSVPEDEEIPQGLKPDIIVIKQPMDHIYLAASAAADMIDTIGGLDAVRYSATDEQNWHVDGIREAMQRGEILYAGKYSTPDYELLTADGCRLAVENMMILHSPEVIGKIEELGIPVIIDHASYESDPLGRLEWVRFYGVLTGHVAEAEVAYARQAQQTQDLSETGKTVAFFYLREDGSAVVRRTDDYVPAMIRMAGGEYIFDDVSGESHLSTSSMQFEAFYALAKDADYIVYNGTTSGAIHSIAELLEKSELLADFTAVREGRVYAVSQDMYQNTMSLGTVVADFHRMMTDAPDTELVFLDHLY